MRLHELRESAYRAYTDLDIQTKNDLSKLGKNVIGKMHEYLDGDIRIYRGMNKSSNFILGDGDKMNRMSANTDNYYTLITELLPSWTNWPKRSKSFICSTDSSYSGEYGDNFFVIPIENQPVAVASAVDFWESFPVLTEKTGLRTLSNFNSVISYFFEDDEPHYQVEMQSALNKIQENLDQYSYVINQMNDYIKPIGQAIFDSFNEHGVMESLNMWFDPVANGCKLHSNYKTVTELSKEVWLSGKVLFLNSNPWETKEIFQ